MYKVELIDMETFKKSRDLWNTLVSSMKNPSFFCTWEWIYTWWEKYGESYIPVILFIYDEKILKGILPLAFQSSSNIMRTRTLSYCGSVELYPDHLDIICSEAYVNECLNSALDFLVSKYRVWDVMKVALVSSESKIYCAANGDSIGLMSKVKIKSVSPYIPMSIGFEEFISGIEGNIKNTVSRKQKKLNTQGFAYRSCENFDYSQGLWVLFHLHELRAKTKGIKSSFSGEKLFEFHEALCNRIAVNNSLWLKFIDNGDKTIAAFYGFSCKDRLFYYQIGFDPEWERLSPGTVLMYEVIKEAFSRGYKEFDFLRGNEAYKMSWTKRERPLYAISIYNKTFRANVSMNIEKIKNVNAVVKLNIKELASKS